MYVMNNRDDYSNVIFKRNNNESRDVVLLYE